LSSFAIANTPTIDLKQPDKEANYTFRIEKEGIKDRIENYDNLSEMEQPIIFDKNNGEFGIVDDNSFILIDLLQ
jgi:hypothetical protein